MIEWIITRFNQPALVEEYLPGREFTVGIVGSGDYSEAIGGMEVICSDNLPYSVEVKENYQQYCQYKPLDNDIAAESNFVYRQFGLLSALGVLETGR